MTQSTLHSSHFLTFITSRFLINFAKRMQGLVVSWQVYQISKEPLALGLIGLFEALPYLAVSLSAGHLVDRHEKRGILLSAVAASAGCSLTLAVVSFFGWAELWIIYLVMGLTGVTTSFEMTSASAYGQLIVSRGDYPRATAWYLTLFQLATILGPILGGWILAHSSTAAAYGVSAFFCAISTALTTRLKKAPPAQAGTSPHWDEILVGLKFIRQNRVMWAMMGLDMVAVLFGDAVAIFPIFAARLGVGPLGLGVLRAAPAVGALVLSTTYALRPFFRQNWKMLLKTVAVFGAAMIGFALSEHFWVSVLFLVLSGAADGISVITRSSMYQSLTPDHLRGRVSSVNGIFVRSSNELGAFESGVAAHFLGAVPSVVLGGVMTLATVAFMAWRFPPSSLSLHPLAQPKNENESPDHDSG